MTASWRVLTPVCTWHRRRIVLHEAHTQLISSLLPLCYNCLYYYIQDGALVIADLTDPVLSAEEANRIFQLLLQQFRTVRKSKVVVLSEAHKYMKSSSSSSSSDSSSGLASELVHVARQLQQQNLRIVVSTQSPRVLPEELLELTTLVAVHSFQSHDWYKHLQSKLSMEGALFSDVTALKAGQALVFARKTDLKGTQQQQQQQLWNRVQIRRRLTHDGMSTAVVPYISSSSGSNSVQSSFPKQSPTSTVEAFSVGI
jgi:ATPase family associated with various cellular activities (AAA)